MYSSQGRSVRLSARICCYGKDLSVREGYDAGLSGDSPEPWVQEVYTIGSPLFRSQAKFLSGDISADRAGQGATSG